MKKLSAHLELLQREPPRAVGGILAGALPWARPDEVDAIAAALLDTGRPEDAAAVIRQRARLSEPVVRRLETGDQSVDSAIASIFEHNSRPAVMQAMHVLRQRGGARFAGAVAQRLTAGRDDVRNHAAGTLREMAINTLGRHGRARPRHSDRANLERAVGTALETWPKHRQDDVLVAAGLAAVRAGHDLKAIVDDPHHFSTYLLRSVVDLYHDPLVRSNLINWLGVPVLAGPVQRRLHEVCDQKRGTTEAADRLARIRRLTEVFADWHLLRMPSRRARLRQVDRPVRCLPDLSLAVDAPTGYQALLPDLVRALPLPKATRPKWWADMIALPAPTARMNALLHLLSRTGREADRAAEPFCFDGHRHVAAVAARHLFSRAAHDLALTDGEPTVRRLCRSAHEPIAREARSRCARVEIHSFFEHFQTLRPAQRVAAARSLLVTHHDEFVNGVREALAGDDESTIMLAVQLAAHLGLIHRCEDQVIELVNHRAPRVAATAVSALARCGGSRASRHILIKSLLHFDARVRANAVEALERTGERPDDAYLGSLARSEDNRLRANALGAAVQWKTPSAGDALDAMRSMLTDVKPLHRISALWQVKRRHVIECKPIVESLAQHEEQPEIRVRAERALRFLRATTRGAESRVNDEVQQLEGV